MGRWVLALVVLMGITQLVSCTVDEPRPWPSREVEGGLMSSEEMESETARRLVGMHRNRRYISYELLRADVVPCSRPGVLYYNCHAHSARANAYHRGCGVISRCARLE